ncbi:hypothetical protein B0H19DRAFT_1366240 [Mycena capillaripes]|nr:hypothetical protein B0H19DRAFT_1366240 [Mycena capillaripes]
MEAFPGILSKEDVEARISVTEANIRRLTTQIDELACELQKERNNLARLWFMVVPVGKLPMELLVEILAFAVQPDSYPEKNIFGSNIIEPGRGRLFGPQHPVHQALLFSQVCSFWRKIVFTSPKLWTAGSVDLRPGRRSNLDILRTMLEHSAPLPISVSLTCRRNRPYTQSTTSDGLQVIAPTASRWKSLRVDKASFEALKAFSPGPFTNLEDLYLQYRSTPVELFLDSPRLRRMTVRPFLPGQNNILRMPWIQMTHLDLEERCSFTCRSILMQCANIVSAKLATFGWDGVDVRMPVVLPFLERLELVFNQNLSLPPVLQVEPFFTPFSFPALESLTLIFYQRTMIWPTDGFSAFQMRAPDIERISLTGCSIASQGLIALLRHSPALTALTLMDCEHSIDNEFLHAFSYDKTRSQPLAPHLEDINWQYIGSQPDPEALEAAIRSRYWTTDTAPPNVARLKKVTMRAFPSGLERMQDLVEHGLELHLL